MPTTDYSAVMVVRDGEAYVAQALASIAAQTVPPSQVVVIDDGSVDGTCDLVRQTLPSAELVSVPTRGQGAGLNLGRELVTGDLVAFLDHDDCWVPDKAAWQLEVIAALGRPAVVVGAVENVTERDGLVVDRQDMGPARVLGACLMTRDVLDEVGPFMEGHRHHAIVDWWSRAVDRGIRIDMVNRPALVRRIHGGNRGIVEKQAADAHLFEHLRAHRRRMQGRS